MSEVFFSFNKLRGLTGTLKAVAKNSTDEAATIAENYAKDHVQVRTGATRDSIHTETSDNSVSVIADGASLFLEYGTVHMRAYPFLRPAMDYTESQMDAAHLKAKFESGAGI